MRVRCISSSEISQISLRAANKICSVWNRFFAIGRLFCHTGWPFRIINFYFFTYIATGKFKCRLSGIWENLWHGTHSNIWRKLVWTRKFATGINHLIKIILIMDKIDLFREFISALCYCCIKEALSSPLLVQCIYNFHLDNFLPFSVSLAPQ